MSDADLLTHRYYRYRACAPAPDADFPGQCLGDARLNVSAWSATDARTQKKAAAACATCPVLAACKTSALTGGRQPQSKTPHTVLGGLLPDQLTRLSLTAAAARARFEDHPRLRYKGCAPSPLNPTLALGGQGLPVDAWAAPDLEGSEDPEHRATREAAAKAVCARCPVLIECRTYANALTPAGQLAEPDGIFGAMTALERHHRLISWRTAQPVTPTPAPEPARLRLEDASTPQKQAVLVALARHTDEHDVAWAADMDVRTANWHRSQLCSMLGLDKETATRWQLLTRARELGVLGPIPIRRDGRWPIAAAPNTEGTRQRRLAPGMPVVKVLPLSDERNVPAPEPEGEAGERPRRRAARRTVRYTVELGVPLAFPGLEYLPRTWPKPKATPPAPVTTGGRHLRPVRTVEPLTLPLPATTALEPAA